MSAIITMLLCYFRYSVSVMLFLLFLSLLSLLSLLLLSFLPLLSLCHCSGAISATSSSRLLNSYKSVSRVISFYHMHVVTAVIIDTSERSYFSCPFPPTHLSSLLFLTSLFLTLFTSFPSHLPMTLLVPSPHHITPPGILTRAGGPQETPRGAHLLVPIRVRYP